MQLGIESFHDLYTMENYKRENRENDISWASEQGIQNSF